MKQLNGIIIIDKPKEVTSFHVVRDMKRILDMKKIGHTGTLDPMATGVLPICIGKGTKAVNYLINDDKEYIAEIKLGENTDTYDSEGVVTDMFPIDITKDELEKVLVSLTGEISQKPPKYSALKLNGKRMYDLARNGVEFEVPTRQVTIYSINLLEYNVPFIKIKVKCSKGTYIRSLAYDIGEKLGCGAYIYNLRRTVAGRFHIDNAVTLSELLPENVENYLISIESLFSHLPSLDVDAYFEKLLTNGVTVKDYRLISKIQSNGLYRTYGETGVFLGLCKREADYLKLECSF
ncbi:tRNA pseudouridine synthase B [Hathewaya proteolytica DSM 3090]|uniref:tRNA pseudouridine synthase B n=1 Tax=Hathewaya proteolytica DSM 3090 TaxID=1121331 RepID=A0A1M6J597_9CLOT|nr:tRNA pseudouridine(55) synthase TruB [Hathewaya proteolytica]SHJ41868.1 tRNA pseudouridine synthase B [Hathewaya proteolytica DSM 3090]